VTSENSHTIVLESQPMNTLLDNPILQTRILSIARGDEDLAQHLRLKLLEKARRDPKFARQELGYWIRAAKWEARHVWEKATIYNRYVDSDLTGRVERGAITTYTEYLSETVFRRDEDRTDESTAFDELPGAGLTPEQEVEQRQTSAALRAAIDQLPDQQRRVASLHLRGFAPHEIGRKLKLSKSSVSHLTARAIANLQRMLNDQQINS